MKENDPPVMTGRTDFDCGMEVYVIEDMPEDYVFTYDEGILTADEIRSLVGE